MKIRLVVLLAVLAGAGAWAVFADHSASAAPDSTEKSIAESNRQMVGVSPEFVKSGQLTYQLMTTRGVSWSAMAESLAHTKTLATTVMEQRGAISLDMLYMYMTRYHGKKDDANLAACLKSSADMFSNGSVSEYFDRDYKACMK